MAKSGYDHVGQGSGITVTLLVEVYNQDHGSLSITPCKIMVLCQF